MEMTNVKHAFMERFPCKLIERYTLIFELIQK